MGVGVGLPGAKRRALARVTVAVAVGAVFALAGACGDAGSGAGGGQGAGLSVGVLLPGGGASRFGRFDRPLIEQKLKQLCPRCPAPAIAATPEPAVQQQQLDAMITRGVDVLILSAIAPRSLRSSVEAAHRAGIPVVAYDRLALGPVSGYVTFDGAAIGRLQGEALLKGMGAKAHGGQIVMLNGSAADPNSGWFERGALSVLRGKVRIGKSYDTPDWRPDAAYTEMSGALAALGADRVAGVLAANDSLAGAAIAALDAGAVRPLPPVTGQDADLAAVQRIVAGRQYMTVYKSYRAEADAAVRMAVALGRREPVGSVAATTVDSATTRNIPSVLLGSESVTAGTIKGTVVKDGIYTVDQICTPGLRSACAKAGLTS